jgi:hypothetical protein
VSRSGRGLAGLITILGLVFGLTLTMPPASAAPQKSIKLIRTSAFSPEAGQTVTFKGTAPKSLAGRTISLQRRTGKQRWVKVASARVARSGAFKVSSKVTAAGLNRWRMRSARINGTVHVSNVAKTRVFKWFHLSDLYEVNADGMWTGDVAIAGKAYAKSIEGDDHRWQDSNWIEYNLSYRCRQFSAVAGLQDYSESGSQAEFVVSVDDTPTSIGVLSLGKAESVDMNVAGGFRIRLETRTVGESSDYGYGAYGNARVLCSGTP